MKTQRTETPTETLTAMPTAMPTAAGRHACPAFSSSAASRLLTFAAVLAGGLPLFAQTVPSNDPAMFGPMNVLALPDGLGVRTPIKNAAETVLRADAPWTLSCWFEASEAVTQRELLAGVGEVSSEYPRYLAVGPGRVSLWMGEGNELTGAAAFKAGEWHEVTATFDGTRVRLYADGAPVAEGALVMGAATPMLQVAPPVIAAGQGAHFGGRVADFTVERRALTAAEVRAGHGRVPEFGLINFAEGSKAFFLQTRGWGGYENPQDAGTLPVSRAGAAGKDAADPKMRPVVKERGPVGPSLVSSGAGMWTFADGWTLREAPKVGGSAAEISGAAFPAKEWMRATVPGTVLTTMVDDGVYPDPYYGLNNMAIPESLNRQDYWYRNVFTVPAEAMAALNGAGGHAQITFEGINYAAEVWLNGAKLGDMQGAFLRGNFDVTGALKPGQNVLAVRIAPPPHPGIPHEQSVLAGGGENGGSMELDGPTFLATEGWDWMPAIRDRNAGIWQPVTLTVTRAMRLGDTQVVATFKNHDYSSAQLAIHVPVTNLSKEPVVAVVSTVIETLDLEKKTLRVEKKVTLQPGESVVDFAVADDPALTLNHPRLWWPNGYGRPELYRGTVTVKVGDAPSDSKPIRFGVREISYELSLLDGGGHMRRVNFTPADAGGKAAEPLVDVSHNGMRQVPGADAIAQNISEEKRDDYQYQTYVASLPAAGEHSPAVQAIAETGAGPYLVMRVNGVRIAARGGNWGMDDARKRVDRERLEPYFRLHRDANLNIIRNWQGQDTEQTFYDLADEYGMLVWNDFWEATENYNLEAEDPALFLKNAADVIRHYRNHPSIALWCGRNEGVPQPVVTRGLEEMVRTLDGTRYYSPSSNQVNLQISGPYSYQDPKAYYGQLNRGFSVETGTPSMSTLESFQSTTPKEDQWPIDDVWAYHDWHQSGNGRVQPFMTEIETEFGAPTGLADFERKAQMLNYVDHRAIFEGMNANLWKPNSGRLLWMTQPAWPSTMWQILSSDYDTQASFYGTKKACEPVHAQLNLLTHQMDVVNTTPEAKAGLTLLAQVYSLQNALLLEKRETHDVGADETVHGATLELGPLLAKGMVLVRLTLMDARGAVVSRNLYWLGSKPAAYRELNTLAATPLQMRATMALDRGKGDAAGAEAKVSVQMKNAGTVAVLASKLTLLDAKGERVLPAYYTDNYVSLLPGEAVTVEIAAPMSAVHGKLQLALRGWNAVPQTVQIGSK